MTTVMHANHKRDQSAVEALDAPPAPKRRVLRAMHATEIGPGATLYSFRLREDEMGTLQRDMEAARPDKYEEGKMFGKRYKHPRKMLSFLRDYTFSGTKHQKVPDDKTPQSLRDVIALINDICHIEQDMKHVEFNSALVNWYANGHEYIAAHADDEHGLKLPSTVATLTLGQARKLRVRRKSDNKIIKDVELDHGKVYIMHGTSFQQDYTHEVPKVGGAKGAELGERISVTLRQHLK